MPRVRRVARTTNLDELARMYHAGSDAFFRDWQQFTESAAPTPIRRSPRLVVIAREFPRTSRVCPRVPRRARTSGLARAGRYLRGCSRFDGSWTWRGTAKLSRHRCRRMKQARMRRASGRRIQLADLLEAQLLRSGDELIWRRPKVGEEYQATVRSDAAIRLHDGRKFRRRPAPRKRPRTFRLTTVVGPPWLYELRARFRTADRRHPRVAH